MATATLSATPAGTVETVAELMARLGAIPPERILVTPPIGTATEADVLAALEGSRKRICELIDGTLVEKAMGFSESHLAGYLLTLLNTFVRKHNLGIVTGADGTVRLLSDFVRIPDVAFTSWDRLADRKPPTEPIPDVVPDLAVEVISPSNTAAEMQRQREEYFAAGVRLVWIIDHRRQTIEVFSDVDDRTTLAAGDTLSGDQVLPGFSIAVNELFGELDRHG